MVLVRIDQHTISFLLCHGQKTGWGCDGWSWMVAVLIHLPVFFLVCFASIALLLFETADDLMLYAFYVMLGN